MSWNKIYCENCEKEVSPKEYIRTDSRGIRAYSGCPECACQFSTISKLDGLKGATLEYHLAVSKIKHDAIRYSHTTHIYTMKKPNSPTKHNRY